MLTLWYPPARPKVAKWLKWDSISRRPSQRTSESCRLAIQIIFFRCSNSPSENNEINQPAFQELIYSDYYVQCTKFKVSFNQQFVPISLQFRLLFSWWFKFISSSEGVSVYIWFHNDRWIIFPMLYCETYRGIEFVCWQNYGYNSTAAGGVVFPSLVIYSSLSAGHSQLEMKLVADRGTEFLFKWTIWDSWK